jgi:hypothetical protein
MDKDEQPSPPTAEENPFKKYEGILPAFPGGRDAWVRTLRDDEDRLVGRAFLPAADFESASPRGASFSLQRRLQPTCVALGAVARIDE